MIPKIIHYCWFGGNPLPNFAKKCIKSWKRYCPDYEIIEWNESNYDLNSAPTYVIQAYKKKKWAFVADYVRLQVVYENGGLYFDTDVEVIKSFDGLLGYNAFFGFELSNFINTGLGFGAAKHSFILKKLIEDYKDVVFIKEDGSLDLTPCPIRNTRIFESMGFKMDNSIQFREGIIVFSSEYFCPKNNFTSEMNITKNTYSIHHYDASWYPQDWALIKRKRDCKNKALIRRKNIHIFLSKIYHFFVKRR